MLKLLITFFSRLSWRLKEAVSAIFLRPFEVKTRTFGFLRVDDLPDSPAPYLVYIAGFGKNSWAASMLCPCGCKEAIELNLLREVRPRWDVVEHANGTVSLIPSVWRSSGCRSHFILRDGLIHWCR